MAADFGCIATCTKTSLLGVQCLKDNDLNQPDCMSGWAPLADEGSGNHGSEDSPEGTLCLLFP